MNLRTPKAWLSAALVPGLMLATTAGDTFSTAAAPASSSATTASR
jgi:hypothetical protein